jgi:hypothetical protein
MRVTTYTDFLNESSSIAGPLERLMVDAKIKASKIIVEEFEKLLVEGQKAYPFLRGWILDGMDGYLIEPERANFVLKLENTENGFTSQWSLVVFWNKSGISTYTLGNFYVGMDSVSTKKSKTWYGEESVLVMKEDDGFWESKVKKSSYFTSLNALLVWIKKSLKEAHADREVRIEFDPEMRGQRSGKKFGF